MRDLSFMNVKLVTKLFWKLWFHLHIFISNKSVYLWGEKWLPVLSGVWMRMSVWLTGVWADKRKITNLLFGKLCTITTIPPYTWPATKALKKNNLKWISISSFQQASIQSVGKKQTQKVKGTFIITYHKDFDPRLFRNMFIMKKLFKITKNPTKQKTCFWLSFLWSTYQEG